jgi:transcriptional regulator with XRE-family HTH domain
MLSGKKLQYIRRLKGFSQPYIASCIGCSERWIGKVENEGAVLSKELYDKWLLALYGGLKPQKKVKAENNAMKNEKVSEKSTTKKEKTK